MATIIAQSTEKALEASLQAGRHALTSGEPVEAGGGDEGPAPHDFLLAGLGACTTMTLRLYAERKGWDLQHVEVQVDGAHDGEEYRIHRTIRLTGALDAEQRERLLQIANRCPVHRTLSGKINIETALTP